MSLWIRTLSRHARRSESGVALVEFALVLPVLLLVLFAMIEFGKAINYWVNETQISAEGARWAAVNKNPATAGSLQNYIKSRANTEELRNGGTSSIPSSGVQICISFPNGAQVGNPVRVSASVTYNWMPILSDNWSVTQTTITASATMRLEALPTVYSAGCSGGAL
jgi:Flp pilus assembly protein TadG